MRKASLIAASLIAASLIAASLMALASPAAAQQNLDAVQIRTEVAAPGFAVLFGAGGNIAVSHGPEGTIVIDDQFAPLTQRIMAAIEALGAPPARYLINTHWHGDHTGGNENFGRAGTIIMAHDHVRDRMSTEQRRGTRVTPPSPAIALPVITWHDGIQLHMNGGIRTMHMPHAHTDGDSVVWFRAANAVHMGDLYFNRVSLPFIDLASGGNARGVLAAADRVLGMADDNTVIIPGHGPLARKADLQGYRDMLAEVIGAVERARAEGKTLEEVVAMRPAARWAPPAGAFISEEAFVTAVWQSLDAPAHHHGGGHGGAHGGGHAEGGHSH